MHGQITQTFPSNSSHEIGGIMLRNRYWPTTFHNVTADGAISGPALISPQTLCHLDWTMLFRGRLKSESTIFAATQAIWGESQPNLLSLSAGSPRSTTITQTTTLLCNHVSTLWQQQLQVSTNGRTIYAVCTLEDELCTQSFRRLQD